MAWVLVYPVVFTINMLNFIKVIQISISDILKAMSRPLIIGLIMALAVNGMEVLILDRLGTERVHAQRNILDRLFGLPGRHDEFVA